MRVDDHGASVPSGGSQTPVGRGADPTLGGSILDGGGARSLSDELRRLGRYQIVGTLGRGGMGTVLEAFDPRLDRPVAIKVLHRSVDDEHATRLLREAQALAKLSHPNVVQVYEIGRVREQIFVAMELVRGQTLREWMNRTPRPDWRACVRLFLQVGAGLVAAHAHGLVHRDFKPGNAIVDDDGRARVLDFGLARRTEDVEERTPTLDPEIGLLSSTEALTMTGAVLGTPAYMPFEQMKGGEADARSDQFSFCVSLYEALYGERPYEGETMVALMMSIANARVRPPSTGSRVPARLRRILLRGLAVSPSERWPSMEALLGELERLASPRQRWLAPGLVGALAAAGLGLAYAGSLDPRCRGAHDELAQIWDEASARRVQTAILGTQLPYAQQTRDRVQQGLDDYVAAWVEQHTEACEATSVRQQQSAAMMDRRMQCLDDRRDALRNVVEVLSEADPQRVRQAVQLVDGLPPLSRCGDIEALLAALPPPDDPQVAAEVDALRGRLEMAEALRRAGSLDAAAELVEPVVEQAEQLGYAPFVAEALHAQGGALEDKGRYPEAQEALERAYAIAVEHGHRRVETHAAIALTSLTGYDRGRPKEGLHWSKTALPLSRGPWASRLTEAKALSMVALVFDTQGDYDRALEHAVRALEIREHHQGSEHFAVALALSHVGNILDAKGQYDEALGYFERAQRIRSRHLGPHHPNVAAGYSQLGHIYEAQGRYEQALGQYEQALDIEGNALGADHPSYAMTVNNIGSVLWRQGKGDEALARFREALEIRERSLEPDHPDLAMSLHNVGAVLSTRGEDAQASEYLRRALAIQEQALGPDHPSTASSLQNLASVSNNQGQYEQALTYYRRVLAILEARLGARHPEVAHVHNSIGRTLHRQGQYEQARKHFERCLSIRNEAVGTDHPDNVYTHTNLGRALVRLGRLDSAKAHFEQAIALAERTQRSSRMVEPLARLAKLALTRDDPEVAVTHAERAMDLMQAKGQPAPADLRFTLARALWSDRTQRTRARELAEGVRDDYASRGQSSKDRLAAVEAWLAKHRT